MTVIEQHLEQELRRGHPETDGYEPPSFAAVLTQGEIEHRPGIRASLRMLVAAAVLVAVVGVASVAVSGLAPSPGGISTVDRHAIADAAGVADRAVLVTEDGAMAARWRDGQLELLRALHDGSWKVAVVASFAEPVVPPGGTAVAAETITCSGNLVRPTFVLGYNIGNGETQLRIHGVDGIGGDLADGIYLFAVAPAAPGTEFWIDGARFPAESSSWSNRSPVVIRGTTDLVYPESSHPGAYIIGHVSEPVACPAFPEPSTAPS